MICPICRTRPTNGAETCGHPTCVGAAIWHSLSARAEHPRTRSRAEARAIRQSITAHAIACVERRTKPC